MCNSPPPILLCGGGDGSRCCNGCGCNGQGGHLSAYGGHDISLDTFPYAGTTTTLDSLVMGVPVITLRAPPGADLHAHNVGASLLSCVGLSDLVADTADEYVAVANRLAADRSRLCASRLSLRQDVLASPLADTKTYRHKAEAMFQVSCAKPAALCAPAFPSCQHFHLSSSSPSLPLHPSLSSERASERARERESRGYGRGFRDEAPLAASAGTGTNESHCYMQI
jgi:hypothetical protein